MYQDLYTTYDIKLLYGLKYKYILIKNSVNKILKNFNTEEKRECMLGKSLCISFNINL